MQSFFRKMPLSRTRISKSVTVKSGQSVTLTLTVTPQNGFNQAISFSCSGQPTGDSCIFSPSTVFPAGAASSTTLSVGPSA